MRTLIINDLHFGVSRVIGTTKQSRLALEEWMLGKLQELLNIPCDRLIILGDMTDKRNIPEHLMKRLIQMLLPHNPIIVLGNHDLGGREDHTMSSVEFMANIMGAELIMEPTKIDDLYIIPHLFSQEEHEKAISDCPIDCYLLTHCNIDSPFAVGDSSLNLSKEEISTLHQKNVTILAAHEHANRNYMNNVCIIGNQIPTSIADCLSGDKYYAMVDDTRGVIFPIFLEVDSIFATIKVGDEVPNDKLFIRVEDEVHKSEYFEAVKWYNDIRKESGAFVISNNISIMEEKNSKEIRRDITEFNIVEIFLDSLTEFREEVEMVAKF